MLTEILTGLVVSHLMSGFVNNRSGLSGFICILLFMLICSQYLGLHKIYSNDFQGVVAKFSQEKLNFNH